MSRLRTWRLMGALVALTGLASAGLVGTGCGDSKDEDKGTGQAEVRKFPANTTMGKIQAKGEIPIGVKFDVPPFGFKNPQTNQVEGFDVDFGNQVAKELGVKPKFVEAISDNRIPFLKKGTVDLVLSTMTINPMRDKEIDFSEPYYIAHGRILVPKGSAIKGVEGLAGKNVCTVLGSTYEETLKKQAPKAKPKLVDTYSECFELIQNKSVDAVATDDVILTGMIIQDRNLQLVGQELTTEPYGAGIKEGDKEFQKFVSDVFAKMERDGGWERSYQKWVGRYTGVKQQPPTLTLQQALKAE